MCELSEQMAVLLCKVFHELKKLYGLYLETTAHVEQSLLHVAFAPTAISAAADRWEVCDFTSHRAH